MLSLQEALCGGNTALVPAAPGPPGGSGAPGPTRLLVTAEVHQRSGEQVGLETGRRHAVIRGSGGRAGRVPGSS